VTKWTSLPIKGPPLLPNSKIIGYPWKLKIKVIRVIRVIRIIRVIRMIRVIRVIRVIKVI
jgi:hypothetical protein